MTGGAVRAELGVNLSSLLRRQVRCYYYYYYCYYCYYCYYYYYYYYY
jgi:hypothetical protein